MGNLGPENLNRSAHRGKHVQNGCPCRIQTHVVNQDIRIGKQGSGSDKKDCGRQIARNVERFGEQLAAAICAGETVDSNGAAIFFDGRAKFFEREFGMVAGTRGLGYTGHAVRKQSGEKNRGLHLGASHGHAVVDGFELGAANFQRSKIVIARANVRTHFAKRPNHALHRPLLQRVITRELGGKLLSGQDSRQQPHRRAGISGIERTPTAFQAAQPAAGHSDSIFFDFHFRAQRAHAGQRTVAISCRGEMA